ncbi:hypothetical protein BC939DRAFT_478342 [Gamsiella multidivaricata]|uniref:uncharacterized protein n=1 Tax=Gamsiella multidivaricata TaxID=101098 RepID=UPI0022210B73|nr:uncharacterized protein BC939DRAFT_478342 [Gamsiella multidivaricata]KAG0365426.1 hypothetical protein BGZ54_006536 [Gamsiella multidivaricata]KAI7821357.1 hypothetical protein BC939DRAFT_478342 [Gamsiella multidivaricata]
MNMFNTDSGFRPPSPLSFAPPSHGLFGEPLGFDDFKLSNQDFLNLPTSPPPPLTGDPSMQLFNPSEQRYFSEFLDTLVVDQDFTFDPSTIPNLPNLPLFTPETMPGGFSLDSAYMTSSSSSSLANPSMLNSSMDFDLTSPSSQSSFSGSHSLPGHFSQGESPVSPGSPSYTLPTPMSNPTKRGKSNKGTETRRGMSFSQESNKMSTPIQQLSKLSLNNSNNGTHNSKKNKRDEDEHPASSASPSSPSRSRERKEDSRERHTSVSDGSVSDAATTATQGTMATTKRKPYKELLTEEEKRANHIASEQKRRNTIRNGFKDMTDIIPDLKDVNSSKSTILFKAVDFIKQLERQNRVLQEKASRLESRLMDQRNDVHGSGLDDQRLQDIPHIYPVPCSR